MTCLLKPAARWQVAQQGGNRSPVSTSRWQYECFKIRIFTSLKWETNKSVGTELRMYNEWKLTRNADDGFVETISLSLEKFQSKILDLSLLYHYFWCCETKEKKVFHFAQRNFKSPGFIQNGGRYFSAKKSLRSGDWKINGFFGAIFIRHILEGFLLLLLPKTEGAWWLFSSSKKWLGKEVRLL